MLLFEELDTGHWSIPTKELLTIELRLLLGHLPSMCNRGNQQQNTETQTGYLPTALPGQMWHEGRI